MSEFENNQVRVIKAFRDRDGNSVPRDTQPLLAAFLVYGEVKDNTFLHAVLARDFDMLSSVPMSGAQREKFQTVVACVRELAPARAWGSHERVYEYQSYVRSGAMARERASYEERERTKSSATPA